MRARSITLRARYTPCRVFLAKESVWKKYLKISKGFADIKDVIQTNGDLEMLKKIVKPACNVCGSVEYILRGARKRRNMAVANARNINMESGIKPKLAVVK